MAELVCGDRLKRNGERTGDRLFDDCDRPATGPGYDHMRFIDFAACDRHALPRSLSELGVGRTWRDKFGFEGDDS